MIGFPCAGRSGFAYVSISLLLAGCGGGSTGSNPFFIGTQPGETASSGLGFAEPGNVVPPGGGDPDTATVQFFYIDYTDVAVSPSLKSQEVVVELNNILQPSNNDLTVTIDGVELSFFGNTASLPPNASYEISGITGFQVGTAALEESLGLSILGRRGVFVTGFETDPGTFPLVAGSGTYDGSFEILTTLSFQNGVPTIGGPFVGSSTVTVNLPLETVGVTLESSPGQMAGDPIFSATDIDIQGNGFAADDLTVSCNASFNCNGKGSVGGAFYGDMAQEVAGVFGIEWVATNTGGIGRNEFVGVGSYLGLKP